VHESDVDVAFFQEKVADGLGLGLGLGVGVGVGVGLGVGVGVGVVDTAQTARLYVVAVFFQQLDDPSITTYVAELLLELELEHVDEDDEQSLPSQSHSGMLLLLSQSPSFL
jgi:hypothetical protein